MIPRYLIHAPFFASTPSALQTAWVSMEKIHASGKAKSIGVSNCLVSHLQHILETAKVKPVVNQIEFHPHLQQVEVVEFCKKMNIIVEAFAPLTALTNVKNGEVIKSAQRMSEKYRVSDSIIMLKWVLEQGIVVITTSGSEKRLKEYIEDLPRFSTQKEICEISGQGNKTEFRGYFESEFIN